MIFEVSSAERESLNQCNVHFSMSHFWNCAESVCVFKARHGAACRVEPPLAILRWPVIANLEVNAQNVLTGLCKSMIPEPCALDLYCNHYMCV